MWQTINYFNLIFIDALNYMVINYFRFYLRCWAFEKKITHGSMISKLNNVWLMIIILKNYVLIFVIWILFRYSAVWIFLVISSRKYFWNFRWRQYIFNKKLFSLQWPQTTVTTKLVGDEFIFFPPIVWMYIILVILI